MDNSYILYDKLLNNKPFCFIKINDGEMNSLKDNPSEYISRGDEKVSPLLTEKIRTLLEYKHPDYYIGIPCSICYNDYYNKALTIINDTDFSSTNALNANILINTNTDKTLDVLTKSLKEKKIAIITNAHNFTNIKKLEIYNIIPYVSIVIPEKFAFESIYSSLTSDLLEECDTIICLCGPLGRVLCKEWFEKNNRLTCLELGSLFDPLLKNKAYLYHTGLHRYCNQCYPSNNALDCSIMTHCSSNIVKEYYSFDTFDKNYAFYNANYIKIIKNMCINNNKENDVNFIKEIINLYNNKNNTLQITLSEENNIIDVDDYRNNSISQMYEKARDFYVHKNLLKLNTICDLYINYFKDYDDERINDIYFYSGFANFNMNRQKAIEHFEMAYNNKYLNDTTKTFTEYNLEQLYPKNNNIIPKLIHLICIGNMKFLNFHYNCIISMKNAMPEYKIIVYTDSPPIDNSFWNSLLENNIINLEHIKVDDCFDGFNLKHNQYKADVLRLNILYEKGGVYLDLDMLIIKNFENIINTGKDLYISKENKEGTGLINSFIAAKPNNGFIKLWLECFKTGLRVEKWAYHIRDSNRLLLEQNKHYLIKYNIKILEHIHFFPFKWSEREKFINIKDNLTEDVYGVHLFETILQYICIDNKYWNSS